MIVVSSFSRKYYLIYRPVRISELDRSHNGHSHYCIGSRSNWIDLSSLWENVHTRLDRSQTDLSSHSSVHIQIAFHLDRSQIDLSHQCAQPLSQQRSEIWINVNARMWTANNPNDSEIDVKILNECEHILEANLDEIDRSWINVCINGSLYVFVYIFDCWF